MSLLLVTMLLSSTNVDLTTLPSRVDLSCNVVTPESKKALQFKATVDYSGGNPSENFVRAVLVDTNGNRFPSAETLPQPGPFTDKPIAMAKGMDGGQFTYRFDLPDWSGMVIEDGVASIEVWGGSSMANEKLVAAGTCNAKVETIKI